MINCLHHHILTPSYLKAFVKDEKILKEINDGERKRFDSFRIDEKGRETKEFKQTSLRDRIKKFRRMQSEGVYDYFIKKEGIGMANLRVLTANKFYHRDQEEMAIQALKDIVDMEAGKEVETPDNLKWVEEELKILEKIAKEEEKKIEKISSEEDKAIKNLLEELIKQN